MSERGAPYVFAAVEVISTEIIDGGRTLAIQLRKADGDKAAVLLSVPLADHLGEQILGALRQAKSQPDACT